MVNGPCSPGYVEETTILWFWFFRRLVGWFLAERSIEISQVEHVEERGGQPMKDTDINEILF